MSNVSLKINKGVQDSAEIVNKKSGINNFYHFYTH